MLLRISGSCSSCQTGVLSLTLDHSEDMSTTGTLDQEHLGSEDVEFLKTLRRTFESMSMGNRSRVESETIYASSQEKPMTMCL